MTSTQKINSKWPTNAFPSHSFCTRIGDGWSSSFHHSSSGSVVFCQTSHLAKHTAHGHYLSDHLQIPSSFFNHTGLLQIPLMRLHPTQLFLLCILLINSSLVSGLCLSNQRSLLLKLKGGFKTLNSKISSWTGGSDCCSWVGVTCDNTTGLVIGLDLSSATRPERITGMIDGSLFQLNSLQSLNLSYNNFNSSIPPGLQNLSSLIHLNLSNAGFIGQIPLQISQMTWLVSLDLSTSYLNSGTTVLKLEDPDLKTLLQNLNALQELRLDGINMSMAGTEWSQVVSSSLHDLRVLSLSNCFLSGPIGVSLLQLPFLSELHLDGNNLSSLTSDSFSNFTFINLTFLNLGSCKLSGQLPENIFWLPYLHTLDISNNPLTGYLPSFPPNSSLQFLLLSRTNLSGSLPETTGNLKFLKKLDLNTCNFSGLIPSSLKNLTQLLILDLSSNNFTGQIPLLASRVQIIDLNQNQLSGAIPSSFGQLLNLTKLNLKNNKLSGAFPPSLLALPLLQNLDLSQNQLRGSIQSSMINATELETLDLSYNMLNGSIPRSIINLTQLKILVLSHNNFSGTIDFELFQNFKNLWNLDLSGNSLTVEFNNPSVTGLLLQITTLKLASCNINDFPPSLQGQDQGQTRLSHLDLSNNKLKGEIPSWIWRAGNGILLHLNLSHNLLTRVGEPINLSSSSLSILDLHDNLLEGTLPFPPSAIVLDYSKNRFASTIPGNIGQSLFYTIYLSLSNNSFTGVIPAAICNASYLSVLDMSHNSFNGSIPECLPNISSSLSVLNLQGNDLQGIIPDRFSNSRNLRTLNLNSNQLIGSIPKSLSNCSILEVLDLGNNHLNSKFPSWLENLPQLQVLVLRSNEFQGEIEQVESPQGFPALKIIDISSNRFTGSLPTRFFKNWKSMTIDGEDKSDHQSDFFLRFRVLEFGSLYYQDAVTVSAKGQEMQFLKVLTIFTAIDFSNNSFSGSIPEELGSLNSLIVLNMSRNSLSGEIPTTLGNLSSLESMDLSHNSLSGQIPSELTKLNFLSVLDLSNNQLSGRIPTGNQFSTFSSTSFEGNKGLCGPTLSLQCTATPPPSTDSAAKIPTREQGIDWHFILVGVGFGGGIGVVLGVLMFWKKGRRWYNGHMDKMLALLLPVPGQIYLSCRVDAEEKVQDLTGLYTDDEGEEEDEEEVVSKRRFCLFCTKLDVGGTRVIHRTCSCLLDSETSTVSSFSIQL